MSSVVDPSFDPIPPPQVLDFGPLFVNEVDRSPQEHASYYCDSPLELVAHLYFLIDMANKHKLWYLLRQCSIPLYRLDQKYARSLKMVRPCWREIWQRGLFLPDVAASLLPSFFSRPLLHLNRMTLDMEVLSCVAVSFLEGWFSPSLRQSLTSVRLKALGRNQNHAPSCWI